MEPIRNLYKTYTKRIQSVTSFWDFESDDLRQISNIEVVVAPLNDGLVNYKNVEKIIKKQPKGVIFIK